VGYIRKWMKRGEMNGSPSEFKAKAWEPDSGIDIESRVSSKAEAWEWTLTGGTNFIGGTGVAKLM
jgi:hypothetical protein